MVRHLLARVGGSVSIVSINVAPLFASVLVFEEELKPCFIALGLARCRVASVDKDGSSWMRCVV